MADERQPRAPSDTSDTQCPLRSLGLWPAGLRLLGGAGSGRVASGLRLKHAWQGPHSCLLVTLHFHVRTVTAVSPHSTSSMCSWELGL